MTPPIETVSGEVRRELTAAGTRSERVALVLTSGERRWRLRRRSAPAFSDDAELAALEGRRVMFRGSPVGGVFLADSWIPLE